MHCPFCNHTDTKVIDSRLVNEGSRIRRRRECLHCQDRFTTYEMVELSLPRIVKRDGRRKIFSESHLRSGILKALEKRPVSMDAVEAMVERIIHRLRASGEREIASRLLGEWVMEELHALDQVAYVRFASVYRRFKDLSEFDREIQRLRSDAESGKKQH